jgi:hypothetical protein
MIVILPSCSSISSLTIDRPRPVPSNPRSSALSTLRERLECVVDLVIGYADSLIVNKNGHDLKRINFSPHHDLGAMSEKFQCIIQKVAQELAWTVLVDADGW